MKRKTSFVILILCTTFMMFSQTVYRVNPESTEPEDGLTWNSGYKSIGAALVAAGDFSPTIIEIWVKSGTYKEAAFWLRNNVEIYGGFLGIESSRDLRDWKKNTTMLVPESAAKRIITRHSATSVKNGVLDGFTLTGVNGTQAAYLNSGNKLKNCIIRNNSNTGFGGGVYMGNGSTIENCLVKDNISEQSGGGIAAGHDNEMGYIKIINCEIVNNASNIDGGGVNVGSYNLEMYNTLIANNTCGGRGGGFRFATPSKASNIINCTIVNNLSGEGNEGGVYLSTISNNVVFVINSIIYGNKAGNQKSNINLNPRVLTSYSGIEDLPTELDKNGNINLMDNQFVNPTPTAGRYVAQDISESISVFENNTGGYACYRIPAITKAPNGDILAFVEARKNSCADFGDLDIVMKRSTDGGVTWSNLQLLVDRGENRAGNIAAVVDYFDSKFPQGRIFLIYHTLTPYINNAGQSRNVHEIWYKTSVDNGHTWENSINITTSVHRPYAPEYNPQYNFTAPWPSMVIGPSSGLQIRNGTKKGRIFVSSYHTVGNTTIPYSNSFVNGFFSDDNGKTWQNSPSINMPYGNESTVAQLADGSILQNFRYQTTSDFFNQPIDSKYRVLSLSTDGGDSWGEAKFHYNLPTPVCHGSMLDVPYNGTHYLFFSHPDSQTIRTKMTIFGSSNNGKTWDKRLLIDSGRSAYSALMRIDDETVGLIYELGDNGGVVFKQVKIGSIIK